MAFLMPGKGTMPVGVAYEGLLRDWFGLRTYEVKVYLALLKGRRTLKAISASSRVPIPRVYDTLRSLEEKGFVQRTARGPARVPPHIALETRARQMDSEAEEKRSKREQAKKQLLPLLTSLQRGAGEEGSDVVLMRGLPIIARRLADIISGSKEVFLLVRKALEAKELFLRYVESLPLNRMKVRMILPTDAPITQDEKQLASKLGVELRRYSNPLLDLVVADRKHVILGVPDPLSENNRDAVAIWVRNPSFARVLHESLESLWRESIKF